MRPNIERAYALLLARPHAADVVQRAHLLLANESLTADANEIVSGDGSPRDLMYELRPLVDDVGIRWRQRAYKAYAGREPALRTHQLSALGRLLRTHDMSESYSVEALTIDVGLIRGVRVPCE